MPYTKSDYPNSMKNLERTVRIKAIDILNAMLEDGYEEDSAIPISISQAKEWIEEADQKEIDELLKKDITTHEEDSDSARLQDADVRVLYDSEKDRWAVKSEGAKQVDSYYSLKKEAVSRAQEIAENKGTEVIKEKKDD